MQNNLSHMKDDIIKSNYLVVRLISLSTLKLIDDLRSKLIGKYSNIKNFIKI